jgi:hypothetical protein
MNISLGWLAFVREIIALQRDHWDRINPCCNPIFDLSSEDIVARRREAKPIAASETGLSVRGRAAHTCLINGCPSVLVAITARPKSNVYGPAEVGVVGTPR